MKIEIINKLNSLNTKINYHNKKYHFEDNPEITDFEFDELCKEYDNLILAHPELHFMERKSIGSNISNQFEKFQHAKPMGSLVNAFTFGDVRDFIDRTNKFLSLNKKNELEIMCEPKIDGLSISLLYLNGSLIEAVTRGDGSIGEIVTENVKTNTVSKKEWAQKMVARSWQEDVGKDAKSSLPNSSFEEFTSYSRFPENILCL